MQSGPIEKPSVKQRFVDFLLNNKLAKVVPFRGWLVLKLTTPPLPIVNQESSLSSRPPEKSLYQREASLGSLSSWLDKAAKTSSPEDAKIFYIQAFQREEQEHKLGTHYRHFLDGDNSAVLKLVKGVGESQRAKLAPILDEALNQGFFTAGLLLIDHYAQIMEDIESRNGSKPSDQWSQEDNQNYTAALQAKNKCIEKTFQSDNNLIGHYQSFCKGDFTEEHCLPLVYCFVESDPETAFSFLSPVLNSASYKEKEGSIRQAYNSILAKATSNRDLRKMMTEKRKEKAK
ncbi:hypothetical protein M3P05_13540 [Sansalvadorimonas sp. 2012CJ34-2]|uniref:DUF4214 domain-containing protein n=1 Tax=Parendozoicomonas callyspongiae TaxID=2942213 RepID=A0ABT0PHV0_9GAMM|nr:hypothetical protein [Sansalvadorimonas sp. 2012CJ34-2]MCL6270948.1 hypothetical protein [Sansalvadorimonas sp. 2012CJ34-2]